MDEGTRVEGTLESIVCLLLKLQRFPFSDARRAKSRESHTCSNPHLKAILTAVLKTVQEKVILKSFDLIF